MKLKQPKPVVCAVWAAILKKGNVVLGVDPNEGDLRKRFDSRTIRIARVRGWFTADRETLPSTRTRKKCLKVKL